MASPDGFTRFYGQIRARAVVSFFAYSRQFWATHASLLNTLGHLRSGNEPSQVQDVSVVSCQNRIVVRPGHIQTLPVYCSLATQTSLAIGSDFRI